MQAVHLHQLSFFAFHGLYEEEKLTGNEFEVNVSVFFERKGTDNHLSNTVDYVHLFSIIKEEMNYPRQLLEEVADTIILKIKNAYPFVTSVNIEIWKMNPPMIQFQGKVGVSLKS